MNPINIIGIGQSIHDLTSRHLKLIDECDVLVGGKRQLAMFDTGNKCIIVVKSPVHALMENLRQKMHDNRIVVLASGDPLFYGIGSTMLSYFDRKDLNIYSNILMPYHIFLTYLNNILLQIMHLRCLGLFVMPYHNKILQCYNLPNLHIV